MKIEELEKRRDEIIGFNKDIANQLNIINEEFKTITKVTGIGIIIIGIIGFLINVIWQVWLK